jgi:hypothetical protein
MQWLLLVVRFQLEDIAVAKQRFHQFRYREYQLHSRKLSVISFRTYDAPRASDTYERQYAFLRSVDELFPNL